MRWAWRAVVVLLERCLALALLLCCRGDEVFGIPDAVPGVTGLAGILRAAGAAGRDGVLVRIEQLGVVVADVQLFFVADELCTARANARDEPVAEGVG